MEIISKKFTLDIYGFSGTAVNKDYSGIAFQLMDRMWKIVKSNNLKNKGLNVFTYEQNEKVFAGVELEELPSANVSLELKSISLSHYAYYKHIGPYSLIRQAGDQITSELKKQGFEVTLPYVELYGHWTNDECKLETELLIALK